MEELQFLASEGTIFLSPFLLLTLNLDLIHNLVPSHMVIPLIESRKRHSQEGITDLLMNDITIVQVG